MSVEVDTALQYVADLLVPQFAYHCFMHTFQGDASLASEASGRGIAPSRCSELTVRMSEAV